MKPDSAACGGTGSDYRVCGIYLSIGFRPDPAHIDVVSHRGPDGRGWRVFEGPAGPVALGHRRLAIIDLDDRALQPMPTPDGRYWLIFNGEIYNYVELREELRALGVAFRTESDAEVLLAAYQAWGERALDKLVGMFAFIVWDDAEKILFAARDRLGIKPLVYFTSSGRLALGSEIKQLIGLPGFSRRINLDRAHNFLETGVTDHMSDTMFADAFNVRPGCFLKLDLKTWRAGDELAFTEYWKLPAPDGQRLSEDEAAEQFRGLFLDSMRLHMRADVRVGSCLSGGLDSSSIVGAQAKMPKGAERFQTISAVFPGSAVDEKKFIDSVVAMSGAAPTYVMLKPEDVFADAEAIIRAQDEPYGSTSIHAQYNVFKAACERNVKVMLDGQGADEILGGYHGTFSYHYARLIRQKRVLELLVTLAERKRWHGIGVRKQLSGVTQGLMARLGRPAPKTAAAPASGGWMTTGLLALHAPAGTDMFGQALAAHNLQMPQTVGEYCIALTRAINLPSLLRYEDRNSMAHSIEARVPFLDHRLVEFALRLGDQHKIVGGDTKRVLRRAMADVLPDIVRNRRDKIGFATPEETWFKGPLRGEVEAGIEDTLNLYPGLLDPGATRAFAKDMLDGRRPFDFSLWRIVIFGIWGRARGMTL
jgi:asparagine synthase (glutamine-hydrolysing)